MPTTDNNQQPIPQTQTPQTQGAWMFQANADFDFASVDSSQSVASPVVSSEEMPAMDLSSSQEQPSSSFDFSLDLPSSYSQEEWVSVLPISEAVSPISEPTVPSPGLQMESLLSEDTSSSPEIGDLNMNPTQELVPEVTVNQELPTSVVEEKPQMQWPFADDDYVGTVDPFEAMKASLEGKSSEQEAPLSVGNQVSSSLEETNITTNQNSDFSHEQTADLQQVQTEMGGHSLELSPEVSSTASISQENVANESVDLPQQSVLDSLPKENISLETPLSQDHAEINASVQENTIEQNTSSIPNQTLSLDEMIAQSAPLVQETSQTPTLQLEMPSNSVASELTDSLPATETSSPMLSLDEMIAQPTAVGAMASELSVMQEPQEATFATVNPLTAPFSYPKFEQSNGVKKPMRMLVGFFAGFFILAGAVMMIVKYPLLLQGDFSFSNQEGISEQITELSWAKQLGEQNEESEHGAALPEDSQFSGEVAIFSGEVAETVNVNTENLILDEVQEISLGEEVDFISDEDLLKKENSDQNSTGSFQEQGVSESWALLLDSVNKNAQDSLSAVEDLVGPISSNDAVFQAIASYKQEAKTLAETGKAQGKRTAIKWGFYVVNQVEKIEQELANGRKMTISEWNDKKAELDLSLAKANDA